MRSFIPTFSETMRLSNRGLENMIFRDMPRISETCGRRSNGRSPSLGMSPLARSSLPGRCPCSSDCRCSRNAGVGVNGRWPLSTAEALALSTVFTRGDSDQVRAAIERGLALAEAFQDRARQLALLAGLSIFFTRIGDIRGALAVAEQAGVIAQAAKHPAGAVWAECWVGGAHHYLGDQVAAQLHCERGLALAAELGTLNANFFGFDHRISALVFLARTLWLRGFSDQALRMVQKAIDEAASRDHPFPICLSLVH